MFMYGSSFCSQVFQLVHSFESTILDFGNIVVAQVKLLNFSEVTESTFLDTTDLMGLDVVKVHSFCVLRAI